MQSLRPEHGFVLPHLFGSACRAIVSPVVDDFEEPSVEAASRGSHSRRMEAEKVSCAAIGVTHILMPVKLRPALY